MCNFLSSNFSNVQIPKQQLLECAISQAATNQIYIVGQASEAPKAAMGADHCGQDGLGERALLLEQTREVAVCEDGHLRSCHLGRYSQKVAAWENASWPFLSITWIFHTLAPGATSPVNYLDIPHSGSWCNQSCPLFSRGSISLRPSSGGLQQEYINDSQPGY